MTGLPSLAALAGDWVLSKKIVHSDGRIDTFEGQATFAKSAGRLIQTELGLMHIQGIEKPLQASRKYIWSGEERRLDVYFEDMRPFHSVPLGESKPRTVHLCPPDRYEVAYDFSNFPDWNSSWLVEGPRKSYRMTSNFRR